MSLNVSRVWRKRATGWLAAALAIGLAAVTATEAQTAAKRPNRKELRRQEAAVAKARPQRDRRAPGGQVAFVDPATGGLRQPTAEEAMLLAQEMDEMLSQSSEGLEVVELGDGTLMVDLQDRFHEIALATIVDGQVRMTCLNERSAIEAFLKGLRAPDSVPPAPAAQALEEK